MTGLRARGGFEVDLAWSAGRLAQATVRARLGGNLRLRTAEPVAISRADGPAVATVAAAGANPNPFFRIVDAGTPVIAPGAALPVLPLRRTTTIDVPTEAGATYTITPVAVP